ncbi:MAG: hypothetical protein HKN76_10855 [Saprospiraceae bacterium]|nr:hypothetical protein [Saprospiraceae bacterium]
MKRFTLLLAVLVMLFVSCDGQDQDENKSLNCLEYWAQVSFADFCGLAISDFDFNTIPNDICNADQNSTFPFDDLISVRVYNHFSNDAAREEYNAEEDDALSVAGYSSISNLGDDAFAILNSEFGQLNLAIVQIVKNTYTVHLEVNGNASNGANNCFDESSVVEFARSLAEPL